MAKRTASAVASAVESPTEEIERLIRQRDSSAAARLAEISAGADKGLAKLARRGLYQLGQAGIQPPATVRPVAAQPQQPSVAISAMLTSPDGNGSQLLLFVQEDPFGGSPWLVTFLINYAAGLKDLGASKLSRREIAESLAEMRAKPGRILVDAPVDYVRRLLLQAVEINRRESIPIPQGFSEDLKRIGLPEKSFDRPLVYDFLDASEVETDQSFSHEPDALFKEDVFKSWLINLRVIAPWVDKFAEAQESPLVLDDTQKRQRGDKVIDEAADVLLSGSGSTVYRRLLEEAALALWLDGNSLLARQALYNAAHIIDGGIPHEQPFLRSLTARSIYVLIALYLQEQDASGPLSGKEPLDHEAEPSPLIQTA